MDESRDDNEDSDEERQTLPVDIVTPDSHKAPVWTHFGFRRYFRLVGWLLGAK